MNVGAIMKNVKNKASPINTWFGGICCVANDVRTKAKTTTTRVKLVIIIKIPGAKDRTVNNNKSLTDVATEDGSELENMSINTSMVIFPIAFHDMFTILFYLIQFLFEQLFKIAFRFYFSASASIML